MNMITKPNYLDPDLYFKSFIDNLEDKDLISALERSKNETLQLMRLIPKEKENFAYAEGKWTVKQLFQHLADCERVFSFRALSIGRLDPLNLPAFDEDLYVKNDFTQNIGLSQICEDYEMARNSFTSLMKSLNPKVLDHFGKANNIAISPRIVGWFNVGHNDHHNKILKERYL
jgi:hypothetical protein